MSRTALPSAPTAPSVAAPADAISSQSAALALATGGTVTHDGDRFSVSFAPPTGAQPAGAATLSRAVTIDELGTAPAPAPAPATPPGAPTTTTAPPPSAAPPLDPDEIYEQVMRRLRREVLYERELRGELF